MSRQIDTSQPVTAEEAEYLRQRGRLTDDIEVEGGEEELPRAAQYEAMSKKELRLELKRRNRDYSDANKDELVTRLVQADEEDEQEPKRMSAPAPQHGGARDPETTEDEDEEEDSEEE